MKPLFACLLCLSLAPAVAAESAYITDKLLAGLYAEPETGNEPLELLPSGTAVEILEKAEGFQRVRLEDGKEGWVNSAYVTADKPAPSLLAEAQARIAELEAQLAAAKACPEAATATGDDACSAIRAERDELQGRLDEIATLAHVTPETTEETLRADGPAALRSYWFWGALPLALVIGLVAGAAHATHRVRKHFGGIRL